MEPKGKSWSGVFTKVSRAYVAGLEKDEKEAPGQYVHNPAAGVDAVQINDFESVSTDFYSFEASGKKNWDGVIDQSHGIAPFAQHNNMAAQMFLDATALTNKSFGAANTQGSAIDSHVADELAMLHRQSARELFTKLHPTQQDVLLCLRDYATLVSWSQVTPSAHDANLPVEQMENAEPWKSLERILSPEALLATRAVCCFMMNDAADYEGLILEEYMADLVGVSPCEVASGREAPGPNCGSGQSPADEKPDMA